MSTLIDCHVTRLRPKAIEFICPVAGHSRAVIGLSPRCHIRQRENSDRSPGQRESPRPQAQRRGRRRLRRLLGRASK